MTYRIPLTDVTLGPEEARAAAAVIEGGWVTMGRETEAFEVEFAVALGARHAVAVCNGTAALHLAYEVAGLSEGDEIILPALTFAATLNAGLYLRARPVLVDCASPDDLTLCPDDLARKITPRTKLIVTMAYGGHCPDMGRIMDIASGHNIPVVEDACHAPLACLDKKCIGTFGRLGAFSFFGNKNMTMGEGGMIVTDDPALDARLRLLRAHGMTAPTWQRHAGGVMDYDVVELGYNYRPDEIRAAVGREQLKKLPAATESRRGAAAALRASLEAAAIPGLQIPFSFPRGESADHLFVALLPPGVGRAAFRLAMKDAGIQTSFHYPPLHTLTHARALFSGPALPVLDSIIPRLVTLPMGPHLCEADIALITSTMRRLLNKSGSRKYRPCGLI